MPDLGGDICIWISHRMRKSRSPCCYFFLSVTRVPGFQVSTDIDKAANVVRRVTLLLLFFVWLALCQPECQSNPPGDHRP